MAAKKKIEHSAPKKQLLTLDQLSEFIEDAMSNGATGSEIVAAVVSWGGKLQKVSVHIETENGVEDARPY